MGRIMLLMPQSSECVTCLLMHCYLSIFAILEYWLIVCMLNNLLIGILLFKKKFFSMYNFICIYLALNLHILCTADEIKMSQNDPLEP